MMRRTILRSTVARPPSVLSGLYARLRPSTLLGAATSGRREGSEVVGLYEALPRYPEMSSMGVLRGLDYMGTVSFAVSGSITAAMSGLDLVGCTFIGIVTALGGGTIRDFLFGKLPVFWLDEREYIYMAIGAALLAFAACCTLDFHDYGAYEVVMFWSDTVGLGAFSVIGAMYAIRLNYPSPIVLLCTGITCTGGGLIRDTLCRRPARVLYPYQETYAITTICGGATWIALRSLGLPLAMRVPIAVSTVIGLRCYAATTGFRLPAAELLLRRQHQDAPELDPVPVETTRTTRISGVEAPSINLEHLRAGVAGVADVDACDEGAQLAQLDDTA